MSLVSLEPQNNKEKLRRSKLKKQIKMQKWRMNETNLNENLILVPGEKPLCTEMGLEKLKTQIKDLNDSFSKLPPIEKGKKVRSNGSFMMTFCFVALLLLCRKIFLSRLMDPAQEPESSPIRNHHQGSTRSLPSYDSLVNNSRIPRPPPLPTYKQYLKQKDSTKENAS